MLTQPIFNLWTSQRRDSKNKCVDQDKFGAWKQFSIVAAIILNQRIAVC